MSLTTIAIIYLIIFFLLYFTFFLTYSAFFLPLKDKFKEDLIGVIDSIEKDYIILLVLLVIISTANKIFIHNLNVIFSYIDILIIMSGISIISTGIALFIKKILINYLKYGFIIYLISFIASFSLIFYVLYYNYFYR